MNIYTSYQPTINYTFPQRSIQPSIQPFVHSYNINSEKSPFDNENESVDAISKRKRKSRYSWEKYRGKWR